MRPGEGYIDWDRIVEVKRRKKREVEKLENIGKPDPFNLDRDYNCVKHVQNYFINADSSKAQNMNVLMYKKVLPCPLRSQIAKVKKTMFDDSTRIIETEQNSMIRSFLKEKAV